MQNSGIIQIISSIESKLGVIPSNELIASSSCLFSIFWNWISCRFNRLCLQSFYARNRNETNLVFAACLICALLKTISFCIEFRETSNQCTNFRNLSYLTLIPHITANTIYDVVQQCASEAKQTCERHILFVTHNTTIDIIPSWFSSQYLIEHCLRMYCANSFWHSCERNTGHRRWCQHMSFVDSLHSSAQKTVSLLLLLSLPYIWNCHFPF